MLSPRRANVQVGNRDKLANNTTGNRERVCIIVMMEDEDCPEVQCQHVMEDQEVDSRLVNGSRKQTGVPASSDVLKKLSCLLNALKQE